MASQRRPTLKSKLDSDMLVYATDLGVLVLRSHDIKGGASTCSARTDLSCDIFNKVIH